MNDGMSKESTLFSPRKHTFHIDTVMASVFTLIPGIASTVDAIMGSPDDVHELERVLSAVVERNDWRKLPDPINFYKMVFILAKAIEPLSWAQRDEIKTNKLLSIIIHGIATHNSWTRVGTATSPIKSEPYLLPLSRGYIMYKQLCEVFGTTSSTSSVRRRHHRAKETATTTGTTTTATGSKAEEVSVALDDAFTLTVEPPKISSSSLNDVL